MVMCSIYQGKCRSVTSVREAKRWAPRSLAARAMAKAFSRRAGARVFVHERHDCVPPGKKEGGRAPKATRSPDERQRNPGRTFKLPTRSRISRSLSSGRPLRAGPRRFMRAANASCYNEGRRNAGRRVSPTSAPLTFVLPACGGGRGGGAARVRRDALRLSAFHRGWDLENQRHRSAPATRFLGQVVTGVYPPSACPSPASSSQTGHSAGRAYSRSRPRTELRAPSAGTAPAPINRPSPVTSLERAGIFAVT